MYVKLTRFDNRPVWLNASFIVTVEPRRDGSGAVVVPIGDGLDYDVRESPEEVLRLLDGAPEPSVVPVPVSDCLTKTPTDVSPEPAAAAATPEAPRAEPPASSAKKRAPRGRAASKKTRAKDGEAATPPADAKPGPADAAGGEAATAPSASGEAGGSPEEKALDPFVPSSAPAAPRLELSEEEVLRLKKMAPKSMSKLKNTLLSQFHIADPSANVAALAARGDLTIDGNRIGWKTEVTDW